MQDDPKIKDWKANGTFVTSTKARGMQVFVREFGHPAALPDQTLLLLHGFPESSFSYHLVVEELANYFARIVLLDLPGFGFSEKPPTGYSYSLLEQADVVLEVWQQLGVTGGHLLAHDMGDSVATELVAREVEKSLPAWLTAGFKSYTFTNGSMVLELANLRITQKLLLTPLGRFISKAITQTIFYHQISSAHGDADLDELEITRLWKVNLYKGGKNITHLTIKYLLDRKRYESKRWLPALRNTKIPVHLCWGDKDNVAKVEMAYYLKERICPDAQLTIMEGVGHFCQLGSPQIWLTSILAFYKNKIS